MLRYKVIKHRQILKCLYVKFHLLEEMCKIRFRKTQSDEDEKG